MTHEVQTAKPAVSDKPIIQDYLLSALATPIEKQGGHDVLCDRCGRRNAELLADRPERGVSMYRCLNPRCRDMIFVEYAPVSSAPNPPNE